MSKCDWGTAAKEGSWNSTFPNLDQSSGMCLSCVWAPSRARSSRAAGQRAWLDSSAPLVHVSSPVKSPTVLGREQATGLGLPHKLEKGLLLLLSSVLVHGSAVNCGSWMKVIVKNLGQFVFLHRGCKCSVLNLGVIQTMHVSLCDTTCSEQTCFMALVCSRLLFCF